MMIILALATLIMLLTLALAPVAGAQSQDEGVDGHLHAHGDGMAVLNGKGTVDVSGSGVLWVRDRDGDASIEVTGYGHKDVYDDGWVQYAGFNGTAAISGRRIQVIVSGVNIELTAAGRGAARLWGHGDYESATSNGRWTATGRGVIVNLAP